MHCIHSDTLVAPSANVDQTTPNPDPATATKPSDSPRDYLDPERLQRFVRESGGVAPAARRLNEHRQTLAQAALGRCHRGTAALLAQKLDMIERLGGAGWKATR
jgi:hypothetical protein